MKVKTKKLLKMISIVIGALMLLSVIGFVIVTSHTQIIVGFIQKIFYGDNKWNSYEAYYEPINGVKENGQYLISEINYGSEYHNSYLDITYPDSNRDEIRPTLIYFHGGGFFSGSKNMGDPMVESEATALLDDICAAGYNVVNIDYGLLPDYHFPDPLIQANQAFQWLNAHAEEYHLDMNNVVIMGSSAGAIMAAQLGCIITNPEYAKLINITPMLSKEQVSAVIIDDSPLDYKSFTIGTKILIGNYIKGSIYLDDEEIDRYNCINYVTSEYPKTFLLGSEYRVDINEMHEAMNDVQAENVLIDPYAKTGIEFPHCFIASERVDETAADAFEQLLDFLKKMTK